VNSDLSDLLINIQSLQETLLEKLGVEWSGALELRSHAENIAAAVYESISATAVGYRCDIFTILKNLIAEAPLKDLARIRTLLVFWQPRFETDEADQAMLLVKFLREHTSERADFFHWALLGGRIPTMTMAVEFFDESLIHFLGFHREVVLGKSTASQEETVRLIGFLARREKILPMDRVREVLLKQGFGMSFPPLEQASFEKLPKEIRIWFLRDEKLRSATIAPDFLSRIESSPLDFPDTPEALTHKNLLEVILPGALKDLSSRSFHSYRIQELLESPELESFSEKILDAIRWRTKSPAKMDSQHVLDLPENLAIKSEQKLKIVLLYLSQPLASRLQWMVDLPKRDALELEDIIPDDELQEALIASSSRTALQKFRKIFGKDQLSKHDLPRLLKSKTASPEFVETFSPDLFAAGETGQMLSLFDATAICLTEITPDFLSIRSFEEFILQCASNSTRLGRFLKHSPAPLLENLLCGKSSIFERFKDALSATLAAKGAAPLRQRLRHSMIELAPDFIGKFLGWEITKTEFVELFSHCIKTKSKAQATALLHFVFKGGAPAWEFLLDDKKCKRLLKPLIRAHRPDLIQRLDQLEAESLLKNPEFREKLLSHLTTSSHTPLGLSRGLRCELIPWVREQFEKKPTLSVAYQLALAFSIKDAGYLKTLCFERWASPLRKNPGHVFDHLYALHRIPKKSGGFREIHAPCAELKRLQSRILENGFNRLAMSRSAHGFHRGRSILTNALPHSGKACVVNVDIDSFFQTTGHNLILQATAHLANGHLSWGARLVLADILSYGGVLPTGAPTSPAIGNLVLRGADAAIAKVAARHGIDYTRYADDLTFSGHKHAVKILPFVEKVLGQLGYKLNAKKTNIYRRGRRQMVTGLVVNEKPNLPRHVRRRLRAAVHTAAKGENPHWNGHPMNKHELGGRISLLNLVDQHKAAALREKLGKATETSTNQ
jgi:retron-type reverse transcriptase